jgi:biopolymer transport protein ExbB
MRLVAGRLDIRKAVLTALALVIVCGFAFFMFGTSPARAQDGDTAADAAEKGDTAPAGRPRLFTHIIVSAGPVFGPLILLISIGLVAMIVLLAMDLRMPVAIPPGFVDEFTDTVNKRKFREAFDLAKNDNSYLGKVLTSGMSRLQYGIEDARETAYHTVESVKSNKEQLINFLATIGPLGPMIGLVGTVYGMIGAFMELSIPGVKPNPQKLADNISHALVITLLGVGLAVPAIFCNTFFRNRLNRISMDAASVADDLLTQMYHNSKRPAGPLPDAKPGSTSTKPGETRAAQTAGLKED